VELAIVLVQELAAPADRALDELLGAGGAEQLRTELVARSRRWAAATAPGHAYEATSIAAAGAALHAHGHDGPALLAAPDVPLLDDRLAADALGDVEAGCDVAVGAAHDGRPYVLAVRAAELLHDLAIGPRDDVLRTLGERGLRFGLLRSERRLVAPADVQALALDPLAPDELVPLLRPPRA
jgi:hypothetical protein